METKHQWYGWHRQKPDARDRKLCNAPPSAPLPASVDLRDSQLPVWNQGPEGSCTAHAVGFIWQYCLKHQDEKHTIAMPARNFIYYNSRMLEGETQVDNGANLRDVLKAVGQYGVPDESFWPYGHATLYLKPKPGVYAVAKKHLALGYFAVDPAGIKARLAAGHPVAFGFDVYANFESDQVARSGVLDMPDPAAKPLGGHAVALVGYHDSEKRFIVRNSWGADWGQAGHFTMPYDYVFSPIASDFWTVDLVQE